MSSLIPASVDDLEQYEESQIELCPDYWTPVDVGENRRAFFMGIETRSFPDPNNSEIYNDIQCAIFCRRLGGIVEVFANASSRLVAIMESQAEGEPFSITYTGKKQNSSNQKQSDGWSIKPLKKAKTK